MSYAVPFPKITNRFYLAVRLFSFVQHHHNPHFLLSGEKGEQFLCACEPCSVLTSTNALAHFLLCILTGNPAQAAHL